MNILYSPSQLQKKALQLKMQGKHIGLVPTMGALHAGHESLIARARRENDIVIVSIFVNPAQFGPKEDYTRYPRTLRKDARVCREAGVDLLFVPRVPAMFPSGYGTYITVEKLSEFLCGASRPGHFRGVATIVAHLFNIAQPSRAYFGMKDYQQLKIIERMAADLHFPVTIVPCPIVREASGLALSSRNQYLSPDEKLASLNIVRALTSARDLICSGGITSSVKILAHAAAVIRRIPGARIDYLRLIDPETLEPLPQAGKRSVLAAAVWVGRTRLIDNLMVRRSKC